MALRNYLKTVTPILLMACLLVTACKKDVTILQPAQRFAIPLKINYPAVIPTIMINLNGVESEVIFDTGSWGLRILKGAADPGHLIALTNKLRYNYGTGSPKQVIAGQLAGANFAIVHATGTTSIRFMAIDSSGKSTDLKLTPIPPDQTRSTIFQGYSGVLGVGLRYGNDGPANPLAQLPGNGKYIVEFPKYNATLGSVILNPNDEDLKGFTIFQLDTGKYLLPNGENSWLDNALQGRITVNSTVVSGPTLLDTGSPPVFITTNMIPTGQVMSGNVTFELTLKGTSSPLGVGSFMIQNRKAGIDLVRVVPVTPDAPTAINSGTMVFFQYDVLFDQVNGLIGLRKKQYPN